MDKRVVEEWLALVEAQTAQLKASLQIDVITGPHPAKRSTSLAATKLDECVLWAREFARELTHG